MNYQLAVAGAGIVGCMTALFANYSAPSWKIVLIDKSTGNRSATSCSAGLILPVKSASVQGSLSFKSEAGYRLLKTIIPGLPFFNIEQVVIGSSQSLMNAFPGVICRPLKAVEKQVFFHQHPWMETRNDCLYLKGAHATYTYPDELIGMMRAYLAEQDNVSFLPGCAITGYVMHDRLVQLQVQPADCILAEKAVFATGPWLWPGNQILDRNAEKIRVKKIVSLRIPIQPGDNSPLIFFPEEDSFLLPVHGKKYWILSIRSDHWDVHPDDAPGVNDDDLQKVNSFLSKYAPAWQGQSMTEKVFCDGYTANREPVVATGSLAGNLVFAGGCSGRGIRLAPGLALSALEQLTTIGSLYTSS